MGKPRRDKSMALKRNGLKGGKIQFCKSCTHGEAGNAEPKFYTVDGTPVAAYLMRRHRNTHQYNSDVEIRECRVR